MGEEYGGGEDIRRRLRWMINVHTYDTVLRGRSGRGRDVEEEE